MPPLWDLSGGSAGPGEPPRSLIVQEVNISSEREGEVLGGFRHSCMLVEHGVHLEERMHQLASRE